MIEANRDVMAGLAIALNLACKHGVSESVIARHTARMAQLEAATEEMWLPAGQTELEPWRLELERRAAAEAEKKRIEDEEAAKTAAAIAAASRNAD